jgi:hypothetical protein
MTALLPGELAWYATGRFYGTPDGELADYGYFLHLPFLDVPLFAGKRSETTAHFTFAAKPFKADPVVNGSLSLGIDPVGEFSLYLQVRPAARFDDPASFAQGVRIATFRRTSLVVGTTVYGTIDRTTAPLLVSNVFSATLIVSAAFEFGGARHDLAQSLGRGVTQFGTAAGTPIVPPPAGYETVLPFTGSAVAIGRPG